MIATDALVVIRGFVFIERTLREVQHTIVAAVALVLEDKLVGLRQLLRSLALTLGHEHIIIEITLVDLPHIHQTEHDDSTQHIFLAQLL